MAQMSTSAPARKVVFGSLGAALSTFAIFALNTWVLSNPMPAHVEGAVTTIVTTLAVFLVGYYVPPSEADTIELDEAADLQPN